MNNVCVIEAMRKNVCEFGEFYSTSEQLRMVCVCVSFAFLSAPLWVLVKAYNAFRVPYTSSRPLVRIECVCVCVKNE